jgi:hypothetical protein
MGNTETKSGMTTKQTVIAGIEGLSIDPNEYKLVERVLRVINSLVFDQMYPELIEKTLKTCNLGEGLKNLCIDIASKDGRNAVISPDTLKTVLV